MMNFMEMFSSMLVLRGIATAHVAALQAKPQMDPGVTHLHALGANVSISFGYFDGIEMGTSFSHGFLHC